MNKGDLSRRVVRNTIAQVCGRNMIALGRLAIAAIIVRTWGKATFGEYSLLFGILTISEWVLDFGTTEVFVRDVCRDRTEEPLLMRTLTASKLVQLPAAFLVLAIILLALRYPTRIVEAGLVGGLSLIFYSGVLVYHTIFKANLSIHLELMAELTSVIVMMPLLWLAFKSGAGLPALLACHAVSRMAFFLACIWLGRDQYRISLANVDWRSIWPSLRTSSTIGLIGLLVVGYEALDMLALSKLSTSSDLAYYSAAQRLSWPIVMALSSVGATLYPLVASYWPHDRAGFEEASQRALNIVLLLAGAAACCAFAGAEFLMGLLGKDLVEGAAALRIFALLIIVKAVSATVGPVLYVLHAQKQALRFIICAVIVKAAIVITVAPRYGYLGVAAAAVCVECFFSAVPSIAILQRHSGYQVRWGVPLKLAAVVGAVTMFIIWAIPGGSLVAGAAAGTLYLPLALMTGAVNTSDLKLLRKAA